MKRLLLILAIAACGGPPKTQHPQLPEDKPPEAPATEVKWNELDGNVKDISVKSDDQTQVASIKQLLAELVGKPLDRGRLRASLAQIVGSAGVADASIEGVQQADGIQLVITVRPQPSLHGLTAHEVGGQDIPLSGALATATGMPLDPSLLQKVVAQLRDAYLARGFTDVTIAWKQTDVATKAVDVVIEVTPGKASTVSSVAFKGNKKVPAKDLDKAAAIAKGAPFAQDAIDRAVLAIQVLYFDRGFINVLITAPKPAGGPGVATFEIAEGDQYHVGKLDFKGDDAKKYLALMGLKSGDVFSRAKIQAGLEKVQTELKKPVEPVTHVDPAKKTVDLSLEVRQ
ncbi:MAG: POTRA domain-containing protein [Kofleriaceae bacterium]